MNEQGWDQRSTNLLEMARATPRWTVLRAGADASPPASHAASAARSLESFAIRALDAHVVDMRRLALDSTGGESMLTAQQLDADALLVITDDLVSLEGQLAERPMWADLAPTRVLVHTGSWGAGLLASGSWPGPLLDDFDLVFTTAGLPSTSHENAPARGTRRIRQLLPGTDVVETRWVPGDERPIDVLISGREAWSMRRALGDWGSSSGRWVLDDRRGSGALAARAQASLSSQASRSKVALVHQHVGFDANVMAGGWDDGIGVVEALAAGCAILGDLPTIGAHGAVLDGLPGVLRATTPEAALAHLRALVDDPHVLRRIAVEHRVDALHRHDVSHRLASVLAELDVPLPEPVQARIAALAVHAEELRLVDPIGRYSTVRHAG
jgi:hypothetical protein